MTARNASAVWHGGVQSGSGTITVGPCVFEGPCPVPRALAGIPEITVEAQLTHPTSTSGGE